MHNVCNIQCNNKKLSNNLNERKISGSVLRKLTFYISWKHLERNVFLYYSQRQLFRSNCICNLTLLGCCYKSCNVAEVELLGLNSPPMSSVKGRYFSEVTNSELVCTVMYCFTRNILGGNTKDYRSSSLLIHLGTYKVANIILVLF